MHNVKDIQFLFPGSIKSLEIINNENILFLIATYTGKGSVCTAIFYNNHLISRRANLIVENNKKIILVSKNRQNLAETYFIDKSHHTPSDIIEYKPLESFYTLDESCKSIINFFIKRT